MVHGPRSAGFGEDTDPCYSVPCVLVSDSADVGSLNQDSSDEEETEDKEKDVQKVKLTSVDEALRTVTGDHSPEDFLKQNFETLADNSSTRKTLGPFKTLTII